MSNIINHDNYVKNYRLTVNEYCLMPKEMRLTYADMCFRDIVDEAKEKGASRVSYFHHAYHEYFKACGCTLGNYNLELQDLKVLKVWDADYTSTEENRQLVAEYVHAIAEVRWNLYASFVEKAFFKQLTNLRMGIVNQEFSIESERLDCILEDDAPFVINQEKAKVLVEQQLAAFIKSQATMDINSHINEVYLAELERHGFTIEKHDSEVIARILK